MSLMIDEATKLARIMVALSLKGTYLKNVGSNIQSFMPNLSQGKEMLEKTWMEPIVRKQQRAFHLMLGVSKV